MIAIQPTWVASGTFLANRLAQKGTGLRTGTRLLSVDRSASSPAESAALKLRKTNIRNVGTTSVLSVRSITE